MSCNGDGTAADRDAISGSGLPRDGDERRPDRFVAKVMVPPVLNTTILGPLASIAALKLPAPESLRLVTSITRPTLPPGVFAPKPSAPGKAGTEAAPTKSGEKRIMPLSAVNVRRNFFNVYPLTIGPAVVRIHRKAFSRRSIEFHRSGTCKAAARNSHRCRYREAGRD
jgi:hypothetical protein